MLWSEARANCTALGGDLAKIPNENVNHDIYRHVQGHVVWAGLRRETGKGIMKYTFKKILQPIHFLIQIFDFNLGSSLSLDCSALNEILVTSIK